VVLPLVDALPRLAAFALVALGLVGTPLMLLDRFDRLPVLLGGGLVLVLLELAWQLTLRRGSPRAPRPGWPVVVASLLAVLVAAGSVGLNTRSHSQHLLVDGDPAVYAVTGQLLAETGSLRIDTESTTVFGGVPSLNYAGAGFDAYDDETVVRPSFLHLLPQALAVASWIGGPQALLQANAWIAGFALLAVFCFGARLTGRPEWSLVAMTALALTLPQQHFSRDTFSELPAQLLVFAGLFLLYDAVRSRLAVPALLAGLVLGVSCLARIDAFFYLVPLLMLATVLVIAGLVRVAGALVAGVAVGAGLGYVVLRIGSPAYLGLQSENLDLILLALAATAVGCAALVAGRRWSRALWRAVHGRVLATSVSGVLVLLSCYAAFVRPRVETGRNLPPTQPTAVEVLQLRAGRRSDPLRSYDELTLQWLTWYLGVAAVALGLLALVVLVWRSLRRQPSERDGRQVLALLGFLLLFGASTTLYLWRPSIIPVHYWATRRFLPVTIPGLLLLAVWLVPAARGRWRYPVGAAVAAALLVPPWFFLKGHLTEREYVPMLAVTERLCEVLEPDDAVVLVGGGSLATGMPQTLRAFCGVPVAVVDNTTTLADVATLADSARAVGRRLVLLSPTEAPTVADGAVPGEFRPVVDEVVSVVALTLYERPQGPYEFDFAVWRAVAAPPP
jgi:hypothetical protein